MKKLKQWLVHLIIGHYYTEIEVFIILHAMQYDMAQKIIGNRPDQEPIVPTDYFRENGKYKHKYPYNLINNNETIRKREKN